MNIPKETEEKIMQLQLLEQNMQNILMQKQQFQSQLLEIQNAIEELAKTKETPYKLVGPLLIASDKKTLEKDLKNKEETLNIRIKNLEKQETSLKEKASSLQEEVLKKIKK